VVTDLANATLTVISVLTTGENASIVIGGVIVIGLVLIFLKLPQKVMGTYFRRN